MPTRRHILAAAATTALASPLLAALQAAKPKHLLLKSSWQTVNIGDIAHTPGALRLLETHLPNVQVTLWPNSIDNGVDLMLQRAFPKLRIVQGKLDADGKPVEPALRQAFDECDFLMHGSGPSVVAQAALEGWRKATGKPYGIYGVTIGAVSDSLRSLLDAATFVYCRDTISLDLLRTTGVKSPVMDFAPDATFALHLRDDDRASHYLTSKDLQDRKFICAVPRLRYTPYYKIHNRQPTAEDLRREKISDEFAETDHAKLREAIVMFVRQTKLKVLGCPEMTYQVPLIKTLLIDPLPDDVKPHVIWRDSYWKPDEAASVYARALAVVSCEMHSPIIAAANATPAIYLRQPTDTSKGQMWRDIGLKDWIFEIDNATGQQIGAELLKIHTDPNAARAKLKAAMEFVQGRQKQSMAQVERSLAGKPGT